MATAVLSSATQVPLNGSLARSQVSLPSSLRANAGHVPGPQLGWLHPTPADTPLPEMRRRLDKDGYVFVKGAIPRSDVQAMRAHYFSQFTHTGLLKPGAEAVDGIYNDTDDPAAHRGIGGGDPEGEDLRTLIDAHADPTYRAFVAHPALRSLVRSLCGWEDEGGEVLLTRTMLRHHVPGGEGTGVHYDQLFLRQASAYFLTAWVPIGDIAYNGGGLIYLERSVELGKAIEADFSRRAEADGMTKEEQISAFNRNMTATGILSNHPAAFEEEHARIAEEIGMGGRDYEWLIANYEAGDVVFHHPCRIHASCANEDPGGRIRLSTDLRFYSKKDFDEGRADERWMKLWTPGDGL